MSTTKHTAGTWAAEHDFAGGIAIISSHRRIHVAHVNKHAGTVEEDTANANLIVAAPALLAALRAILPYAESRLEDMDDEEEAIERGEVQVSDEGRAAGIAAREKAVAAYQAARAAIAAAEGRR